MEIALVTDADWQPIEDYPCRVTDFVPMAKVEDGEIIAVPNVPYAAVHLECSELSREAVGYICHRVDFIHLWAVFKERGVEPDEEVIIFWSKRHLTRFAKFLSFFTAMPRLCVMICPKGACELMTDPDCRPELQGLDRWHAERPIVTLKPVAWA